MKDKDESCEKGASIKCQCRKESEILSGLSLSDTLFRAALIFIKVLSRKLEAWKLGNWHCQKSTSQARGSFRSAVLLLAGVRVHVYHVGRKNLGSGSRPGIIIIVDDH